MKKFILISALFAICTAVFTACAGCSKEAKTEPTPEVVKGIVLENTISTDREFMYLKYAADYVWYESQITLCDNLNAESCDGAIDHVTNVYQFIAQDGEPQVILSAWEKGKIHNSPAPIADVYLGDNPISNVPINLTFKQAFERLKQANTVLPGNRQCVLRKPVQPDGLTKNPQYIFGGPKRWVKVDAVTGDVTSGSDPDPDY